LKNHSQTTRKEDQTANHANRILEGLKMKKLSSLLLLTLFLVSCTQEAVYNKSFKFQDERWNQDVKPSFEVDIQDTSIAYDFVFTLRSTTDYAYNNLWVFLSSTAPTGKSSREPYEIKMAYPDGNWIGKKSGTIVEHELIFPKRKLPFKGKYRFTLEQAITQKIVDEVLDLSLEVRKSEEQ
jgi:gliding motility-associated lipoprotein GldH